LERFDNTKDAVSKAKDLGLLIYAGELDDKAVALDETVDNLIKNKNLQNKLVIL
jgi:hypothetical protein